MERGEGVVEVSAAYRRRFLLDLTYPAVVPLLCDHFGLLSASDDVTVEEIAECRKRMERLGDDPRAASLLGAAKDMEAVLDLLEPEDFHLWLVTYALAVVNLLEDLGLVKIV